MERIELIDAARGAVSGRSGTWTEVRGETLRLKTSEVTTLWAIDRLVDRLANWLGVSRAEAADSLGRLPDMPGVTGWEIGVAHEFEFIYGQLNLVLAGKEE